MSRGLLRLPPKKSMCRQTLMQCRETLPLSCFRSLPSSPPFRLKKGKETAPDRRRLSLRFPLRSARIQRAWSSEDHTSELHSLIRSSYAVFCLIRNNQNSPPTCIQRD